MQYFCQKKLFSLIIFTRNENEILQNISWIINKVNITKEKQIKKAVSILRILSILNFGGGYRYYYFVKVCPQQVSAEIRRARCCGIFSNIVPGRGEMLIERYADKQIWRDIDKANAVFQKKIVCSFSKPVITQKPHKNYT